MTSAFLWGRLSHWAGQEEVCTYKSPGCSESWPRVTQEMALLHLVGLCHLGRGLKIQIPGLPTYVH